MAGLLRLIARHRWPLLAGSAGAVVVILAVIGGEAAMSSTSFCVSCHSMSYPAAELEDSNHYGPLGVDPECKDCHIPQGLANIVLATQSHLIDGLRGIIGEVKRDLSSEDKFDEHRLEFAHNARMNLKRWDSVTCRACHKNPRPPLPPARAAHATMESDGATCIDCHQNLVHERVPETDLDASLATGRMVLKEDD